MSGEFHWFDCMLYHYFSENRIAFGGCFLSCLSPILTKYFPTFQFHFSVPLFASLLLDHVKSSATIVQAVALFNSFTLNITAAGSITWTFSMFSSDNCLSYRLLYTSVSPKILLQPKSRLFIPSIMSEELLKKLSIMLIFSMLATTPFIFSNSYGMDASSFVFLWAGTQYTRW